MFRSLRGKLIAFTILVQTGVLGAIVWNSQRVAEEHLIHQFEIRRGEATSLLQAALAPAMAQRDYAAVSDTLKSAQTLAGMTYLIMFDEDGQAVAFANWDRHRPPPRVKEPDQLDADEKRLDLRIPIAMSGRPYGTLQIGLDRAFLQRARDEMLVQNLILAVAGMIVSSLILGLIAVWLTRRLKQLAAASGALAAGEPFLPLAEHPDDDLGQVARAFNHMAGSLQARMAELRQSEAAQRRLVESIDLERYRLAALFASMRLGLVLVSRDGTVSYANPSFNHLWQIDAAVDLRGRTLAEVTTLTRVALPDGAPDPFGGDGSIVELAMADDRIITRQGTQVLGAGGQPAGYLWICEDVTSERQAARQLLFLAERDPLTGLANRNRFESELARLVALVSREPDTRGALLYFDLDEFKVINDTFGHSAGDAVLLQVASAISGLVRSNEVFARLGGDEFAILVPGADAAAASSLAERVVHMSSTLSFEFEQHRLGLTISLGIALFPEHARTAEELVSHADAAMYQVKHAGKNAWTIYRPDLDLSEKMLAQLSWNERILAALAQESLVLHFQAVYNVSTRDISHFEALVRIRDDSVAGGVVMPGEFIPAAERNGRIVDIDRWVIAAAIGELADKPDLPGLAVNISARTFDQLHLGAYIRRCLARFHVKPSRLVIELTETAALANLADAQRFIDDIRHLGCTVCLDDFGVGFSSFVYLKHLHADVLKIDGMFIRNLPVSHEDQVFVRAIVEVARGLGKKTVAEFFGDEETLLLLAEIGVDYAQGYYLGRPLLAIPSSKQA